MKALGKGSIASWVKVGLQVAGVVLWILLSIVVLATLVYGVVLGLVLSGLIHLPRPALEGWNHLMWQLAVPALLLGAFWLGGALVIVRRLRQLFESFTSGEPFKRENADHLRVIWITMFVMELAKIAFGAIAITLIAIYGMPQGVDQPDVQVDSSGFDLTPWISIIVLIVLAEVFREGARMREEQELTI